MSNQYTDELGNIHTTDKMLGQGGQGIVWRTTDPDLALKIVPDLEGVNPETDPKRIEGLRKMYAGVRRLPVPKNCQITIPLVQLIDAPGYVMRLMAGLKPMTSLWPEVDEIALEMPEWLTGVQRSSNLAASQLLYYSRTGSLRRRLAICSLCAAVLGRLHARGLVYGDISTNNIFVDELTEYPNVWLIDADNLCYEREKGGKVLYTPSFGAPELVQGMSSCTTASDCYAFAVTVFKTIVLAHPFIGSAVDKEDEECDWAEEDDADEDGEQKAYSGKLPWIDDPNDDSNRLVRFGLPRQLVLTEELKTLFEATFCKGRLDPARRPLIWHWAEALARAVDQTVTCPDCGMSYFAAHHKCCPYCEAQLPPRVDIQSYRLSGKNGVPMLVWRLVHELPLMGEVSLPARCMIPFESATAGSNHMITLRRGADALHLSCCEAVDVEKLKIAWSDEDGGKFKSMPHKKKLPPECREFYLLYTPAIPYLLHVAVTN